eukprot:CAMPEP_0178955202 /NCGR_PEP_ID=MMETSP0789-20121207/9460_1 /TAXON_ID=3005 /ORGANISM="Rhizosolenia setigera, Strain CCMP 1694" /LENGTH=682 /DNA_ID=CAMNT_0020636779 /DNA_START=46 /DNA_END=2094 /DNA_ORIENTATION=+
MSRSSDMRFTTGSISTKELSDAEILQKATPSDIANAITNQNWPNLGSSVPSILCKAPTDEDGIVERFCYILLVRIMAIVSFRNNPEHAKFRCGDFDLDKVSDMISLDVQEQLFKYVTLIVRSYNQVHYHSVEHAYHVVISANKLLDMLLQDVSADRIHHSAYRTLLSKEKKTYGIKFNPLLQFAFIFSALIHDAGHEGVSNAQLIMEEHDLAILYNDQSVAEQQSLSIAFRLLTKKEFVDLKNILFKDMEEYRYFRKTVIDLVMCTDVASPERTQIVKSKWKEAFGETSEQKAYKQLVEKGLEHRALKTVSTSDVRRVARSRQSFRITESDDTDKIDRRNHGEKRPILSSFLGHRNSMNTFDNGATTINSGENEYISLSPSESETNDTDDEENDNNNDDNGLPPTFVVGQLSVVKSDLRKSKNNRTVEDDEKKVAHNKDKDRDSNNSGSKDRRSSFFRRSSGESLRASGDDESGPRDLLCRRLSAPVMSNTRPKPNEYRLGIKRAVDLTGAAVIAYATSPADYVNGMSIRRLTIGDENDDISDSVDLNNDEPDDFRASVVLEHMLRAADISANMQSWKRMQFWSSRLFFEQKAAFECDRMDAVDPAICWYGNQLTFFDSYVIPLARRLNDTGSFGNNGQQFAAFAEENRRTWVTEGKDFTDWMIRRWEKMKEKKLNLSLSGS